MPNPVDRSRLKQIKGLLTQLMKYEKGDVIICDAMFDRTKRRLREQRGGSTGLHLHRTKSQGVS